MRFDVDYFKILIANSNRYFAHLPKDGDDRSPELLAEHSALVFDYAKNIVAKQQLCNIISDLIDKSIPEKVNNKQLLAERIEILFWQAIAFHAGFLYYWTSTIILYLCIIS